MSAFFWQGYLWISISTDRWEFLYPWSLVAYIVEIFHSIRCRLCCQIWQSNGCMLPLRNFLIALIKVAHSQLLHRLRLFHFLNGKIILVFTCTSMKISVAMWHIQWSTCVCVCGFFIDLRNLIVNTALVLVQYKPAYDLWRVGETIMSD